MESLTTETAVKGDSNNKTVLLFYGTGLVSLNMRGLAGSPFRLDEALPSLMVMGRHLSV